MVYGISRFLSMATEVEVEFILKRFWNSLKDYNFMRKDNKSIIVYHKDSTQVHFFKTFTALVYSTLQISKKNLRKQMVTLSFILHYRKSAFLKIHNILDNPQIFQQEFCFYFSNHSQPSKRAYPLYL